jgi:hypothetical protein
MHTSTAAGEAVNWVRPHLPSARELALLAAVIVGGMFAVGAFDEWRGTIKVVWWLLMSGLVAFLAGRAFWSWWKAQPEAIVTMGAMLALAFALVGWLDVALARAVRGISEGNYALIIIGPLMMMLGALVSLGGLLAAALGVAVIASGLRRPAGRGTLLAIAGLAAVGLNFGHIFLVVRVLEGR